MVVCFSAYFIVRCFHTDPVYPKRMTGFIIDNLMSQKKLNANITLESLVMSGVHTDLNPLNSWNVSSINLDALDNSTAILTGPNSTAKQSSFDDFTAEFLLNAEYQDIEQNKVYMVDEEKAVSMIWLVFFNMLILFLMIVQLHQLARVFMSISDLVELLAKVYKTVTGFTIYFFLWIYVFCILYYMTGITFGNDDYPGQSNFIVAAITSYRISIADFTTPDYSLW